MFALARTFGNPAAPANAQRGQAQVGAGLQQVAQGAPAGRSSLWEPKRPTKGRRTWSNPASPAGSNRGMPSPLNDRQARPAGDFTPQVAQGTGPGWSRTPYYSMGAGEFAPQFGQVLTNPIGAGIVVSSPMAAESGQAAEYVNGVIYFATQNIPTSLNFQGLTDPEALAAILGPIYIEAAYPVG